MSMGLAGGLAAATAIQRIVLTADLDGAELHTMLQQRGVQFLPRA